MNNFMINIIDKMTIMPFGSHSVLIQWKASISPVLNKMIHHYADYFRKKSTVKDVVPAYESMLITYNHALRKFDILENEIRNEIDIGANKDKSFAKFKTWEIPVCYDTEYGIDLDNFDNMQNSEVVAIHSNRNYHCYMLGFLPGFPFLGFVDNKIAKPRRTSPRKRVAMGSVGIANKQTGIYPMDSPGGWNIVGHTPIPLFNKSSDHDPTLIQAGDTIRFTSISKERHIDLSNKIQHDTFDYQTLRVDGRS